MPTTQIQPEVFGKTLSQLEEEKVVSLDEIARNYWNGKVLIDTSALGTRGMLLDRKRNRSARKNSYLLGETAVARGELRDILESNPNITTIQEVLEERDSMPEFDYENYPELVASINSMNRSSRLIAQSNFRAILKDERGIDRILRQRIQRTPPGVYLPMISLAHIAAAELIPLVSDNRSHYLENQQPENVKDELLVAKAFTLSALGKKTVLVSYDTRTAPLVGAVYSLLFAADESLASRIAENEVGVYSFRKGRWVHGDYAKVDLITAPDVDLEAFGIEEKVLDNTDTIRRTLGYFDSEKQRKTA